MTDQLTLKVDGRLLSGWMEIEVTRGIERLPNSFAIAATEGSPVFSDAVMVKAGQACTVSLGADLVITGYVDAVVSGYAAGSHTVSIQGRGKCQDLVDCSAVWKGGQISNSNALQIARNLAAPFGINVTALCDPGRVVPQFNINIGESPGDILELITRNEGLLYYEDTAGNLVLARVGTDRAGSGFVEGQNVQQATVQRSMSDRHSEYTCSLVSIPTGPLYEAHDGLFFGTAKDPNVPRYRPLFLVAESGTGSLDLVKRRALWEAARRAGRGEQVRITVDSWRDGAGKLWTPNTLAPVSLPRLKLKEAGLCIGQVTHRLGLDTGRTAEITLMPKEAFLPQPIVLQAVIPNLVPKPGAAP